MSKARVRWLISNLFTALVASTIISLFEDSIARMVALATLMPIVAGVGGNAGTQTLAVTVRALATNQLTRSNAARAVGRELRVALLNGGTVALAIGVGVSLVFRNPQLGMVIAAAMMLGPAYGEFGIEQIEINGIIDTRDYSIHRVLMGGGWWARLCRYAAERRGPLMRFTDKMVRNYEFEE